MNLEEVKTRDPVPEGGPGAYTQLLRASNGWALAFDAGMIKAARSGHEIVIPVQNVAYMKLAAKPPPVKPVKAA